jgi:outer membrane protein assembly factor BamB
VTDTTEINAVDSSAAVSSNGIAYIGSGCGLFAYAVSDGALAWSIQSLAPEVEVAPAIGPDGTVFFAAEQKEQVGSNRQDVSGTIVSAVTGRLHPAVF